MLKEPRTALIAILKYLLIQKCGSNYCKPDIVKRKGSKFSLLPLLSSRADVTRRRGARGRGPWVRGRAASWAGGRGPVARGAGRGVGARNGTRPVGAVRVSPTFGGDRVSA